MVVKVALVTGAAQGLRVSHRSAYNASKHAV